MDKEKKGFWAEFRAFVARGSVIDMAVGVIIGAAFKAIVDSLVNDIVMPFVGILVSAESFAELTVTVGGAVIAYGKFISAVLNFLIMAFVIFTIVRYINKANDKLGQLRNKKKAQTGPEPAPAPAPEPPAPTEAELLAEILAVLKDKSA